MTLALERQQSAIHYFRNLQDQICAELERVDGKAKFHEDDWERQGGGGGRTRVLAEGGVFEKAGVNFSDVAGQLSADFARQLPGEGTEFTATGISLVLHPSNPMIPTVHANFRYLTKGTTWWFGGGADLTPYYPRRQDAVRFHLAWKQVCDRHQDVADYQKFKKACDDYFFLPHRQEARGIGGIFFDFLGGEWSKIFDFVQDAGQQFLIAYLPIALARMHESFTQAQREFQQYRRGRYVEFNLLYDRGTIFGLKTGGRIESILMSMPPTVRWCYDYRPAQGSPEAELAEYYLKPRDWVSEEVKTVE